MISWFNIIFKLWKEYAIFSSLHILIIKHFDLFQLCDINLRVGITTLSAHRVVLAAASPYFHAMFNGKYGCDLYCYSDNLCVI